MTQEQEDKFTKLLYELGNRVVDLQKENKKIITALDEQDTYLKVLISKGDSIESTLSDIESEITRS